MAVGVSEPPPRATDAAGPDDPGNGQRALPCLPAGPARAHPGRAGRLLDLAAADVRDRRGDRAGPLLRPRPRDLRGNGAGRDHGGRRVPLPPSRPRRRPLRRPERDGEGRDRRGPRGGNPHHPARHLLPPRRDRARRRRASSCASPTAPPTPGPSGSTGSRSPRWPGSERRSTAFARSTRRPRPGWRPSPPSDPGRSTPMSPSSRPRTTTALAAYGKTPTALLAEAGALSERFTAVHATHLDEPTSPLLGGAGCGICLCPTTERDLADGVGPARRLAQAGARLSLGTDSHALIDLFEEARAVELDERLESGIRGGHSAAELLRAATAGRRRRHRLARGRRDRPGRARRPGDRRPRRGAPGGDHRRTTPSSQWSSPPPPQTCAT